MSLPRVPALRRRDVLRFEFTVAMPHAVRTLQSHLSSRALARVMVRVVVGSTRDPLGHVPLRHGDRHREMLARRQFRTVFVLDDALRAESSVTEERRLAILADVMATVGSLFIAASFPTPARSTWQAASTREREAFLRRATRRLINADIEHISAGDDSLGFDVSRCLFAELAGAVGRPYLGALFCMADEAYFGERASLVQLERGRTIARGDRVCDFRFRYR